MSKTRRRHCANQEELGDHITADHVVLYRDNESIIEDSRLALVIKDVATTFIHAIHAYPSALKSEDECYRALIHFTSSRDSAAAFYSDNAKDLVKAVSSLGWRHELSKAYIHQSKASAERAVRSSTEGKRADLLQAGLSHVYWPHALEHACSLFNLVHPNGPQYAPCIKRFGIELPGALLRFGCRIDYWLGPKSKRAKEGRERFAPASGPGIFLGYSFQPGMKWKNEILVVPVEHD